MKHVLKAETGNIFKGRLDPGTAPVLFVESGDTVVLETLSAISSGPGPYSDYCEEWGLDQNDPMIKKIIDAVDLAEPKGRGGHMMTGPVYVKGAKPGDTLELRILDMELTLPYGNISVGPGAGALPDLVKERGWRRVVYDEALRFGDLAGFKIPLDPFFGVMGVMPEKAQSSTPPGPFGGNLDLKYLTKGASAFFPVQAEGALFYAGDAHSAQGNGEVGQTAIETAGLTGTLQVILHKGLKIGWPMAQTPGSVIITGMDEDLDEAARLCLKEAAGFLMKKKGIAFNDALMLLSAAADLEATQLVDGVKGMHCVLPRRVFGLEDDTFWNADGSVRY